MILIRTGTLGQLEYKDIHFNNVAFAVAPYDIVGNTFPIYYGFSPSATSGKADTSSGVVVSNNNYAYGGTSLQFQNNSTSLLGFPSSAGSRIDATTSDLTIEYFINLENLPTGTPNFSTGQNTHLIMLRGTGFLNPSTTIFSTFVTNDKLYFQVGRNVSGLVNTSVSLTEENYTVNTWAHVAYTKTRIGVTSNAFHRLFFNGKMVANVSNTNTLSTGGTGDMIFLGAGAGWVPFFTGQSFKGYIDDIRITLNSRYTSNFVVSDIAPFANNA